MQDLFRGIAVETEKWVYGDLVRKHGSSYIVTYHKDTDSYEEVQVIAHTVGRFTGCIDRQGQRIFEDDITKSRGFHSERSYGLAYDKPKIQLVYGWHFAEFVKKAEGQAHIEGNCYRDILHPCYKPVRVEYYKVIGNRHKGISYGEKFEDKAELTKKEEAWYQLIKEMIGC